MSVDKPASAATVDRNELVTYIDNYLLADQCVDFCPNGLQVEGRATIRRIVTGVSACQELFERARRHQADSVLVHHGIFWEGTSRTLTGYQLGRVAQLIEGHLNLIAYHLPLDRHPEVGNNAIAARRLGPLSTRAFRRVLWIQSGIQGEVR